MFAARRRLTRSGLSPMGSIASGIDDVISMDSVASQNNIPPQHPNHPAHDTASVLGTTGVVGSCLPGGVINRPISLYILCEKQMTKVSLKWSGVHFSRSSKKKFEFNNRYRLR
ncbi:unnamed protein product [Trichobilharzia regenti]|nr:unnamed protein product [Trichobilharzia regenti]